MGMSIGNAYIKRWLGVFRETNPLCYFIGTIHQSDLQILWVFLSRSSHFHLFFRSVVDFLSHTWRNRDLLSAFVYNVTLTLLVLLFRTKRIQSRMVKSLMKMERKLNPEKHSKEKLRYLISFWVSRSFFHSHRSTDETSVGAKKTASFCFLFVSPSLPLRVNISFHYWIKFSWLIQNCFNLVSIVHVFLVRSQCASHLVISLHFVWQNDAVIFVAAFSQNPFKVFLARCCALQPLHRCHAPNNWHILCTHQCWKHLKYSK